MRNRTTSPAALRRRSPELERIIGWFGLVLIGLLGWACEQRDREPHTVATQVRGALAWLVVESITGVGWAIDRVALRGAWPARGGRRWRIS
jgi:hypothetical protein